MLLGSVYHYLLGVEGLGASVWDDFQEPKPYRKP